MAGERAFRENYSRYDMWFDNNKTAYELELKALERFIPGKGTGLEIGVGTGKFAVPLGVFAGADPVFEMFEKACAKGIKTVCAKGEKLPFKDNSFDYLLCVTAICFFDDILASFKEAFRVLKNKGSFILGFVDKASPLGQKYLEKKEKNVFYKEAFFYTVDEIVELLEISGFNDFGFLQTLIGESDEITQGYGRGGFAVIKAFKKGN